MVLDRTTWTEADQAVIDELEGVRSPVIIAINKLDRIEDKGQMLPYLEDLESNCSRLP